MKPVLIVPKNKYKKFEGARWMECDLPRMQHIGPLFLLRYQRHRAARSGRNFRCSSVHMHWCHLVPQ